MGSEMCIRDRPYQHTRAESTFAKPLVPPVSFCLVDIRTMACPLSQLITAETSSSRWLPVSCYSFPSWLLFSHTESCLSFLKPLIHRHHLVSIQTSRCISDRFPSDNIVKYLSRSFSRSRHVELEPRPKLPPSDRHYGWLLYFQP